MPKLAVFLDIFCHMNIEPPFCVYFIACNIPVSAAGNINDQHLRKTAAKSRFNTTHVYLSKWRIVAHNSLYDSLGNCCS